MGEVGPVSGNPFVVIWERGKKNGNFSLGTGAVLGAKKGGAGAVCPKADCLRRGGRWQVDFDWTDFVRDEKREREGGRLYGSALSAQGRKRGLCAPCGGDGKRSAPGNYGGGFV